MKLNIFKNDHITKKQIIKIVLSIRIEVRRINVRPFSRQSREKHHPCSAIPN